jgi:hypothetical protein
VIADTSKRTGGIHIAQNTININFQGAGSLSHFTDKYEKYNNLCRLCNNNVPNFKSGSVLSFKYLNIPEPIYCTWLRVTQNFKQIEYLTLEL